MALRTIMRKSSLFLSDLITLMFLPAVSFPIVFIRVVMSSASKLHSVECRASSSIRNLSQVSTIHGRSETKGFSV